MSALTDIEARLATDRDDFGGGYADQSIRDREALLAMVRGVQAIHTDGGSSQGYTDTGYGEFDHACITCGEHGEYGIEWPCETYKAAS